MILSIFEAIENLDDNSVEYDDDYEFQLEGKNVYLDKSSIQIDVDSFREYVLNDIKGALDDCAEELIQDLQQEEKEEC